MGFFARVLSIESIYYNQFEFHFFGDNTFYVHACVLTFGNVVGVFGKPRKVWCKFNKYAVTFNTSCNTAYGFAHVKKRGVFFPRSEQFFVA